MMAKENVVCAFMQAHKELDYSPFLIYLCGPFIYSCKEEVDVYYCLEKLMDQIRNTLQY